MEIKSDQPMVQYGRRAKPKGRSLHTYLKKLDHIKKWYQKTLQHSLKQKETDQTSSNKHQKQIYFCDKYPTEEKYLKNIELKSDNIIKRGVK